MKTFASDKKLTRFEYLKRIGVLVSGIGGASGWHLQNSNTRKFWAPFAVLLYPQAI